MKFSRQPVSQQLAQLHEEAEERDARRRAEKENLPYLGLKGKPLDPRTVGTVPEELARSARAAVVEAKGRKLVVALYNLKSLKAKELLNSFRNQGLEVKTVIVSLGSLAAAWKHYAALEKKVTREDIISAVSLEEPSFKRIEEEIKSISDLAKLLGSFTKGVSTSEAVNLILGSALVLNASDVHLEYAAKARTLVRFRIDGILRDVGRLPPELIKLLVKRLKLLSNLKLNVTDVPQDGRFTIQSHLGPIEVRTSVVPAEFGESVVMRILNPETIALELGNLGLREDDEKIVLRELKRPNGMILVTGPTGSGKTTTLYAFLKKIKTPAEKIITIEDPIEYHLEGIEQTQVEPERGYTFAIGLRSVLRQDPDIILVGEIRDLETAETSIHAALTGHLVFSTLHTNDASGAIPRLIDLGAKPAVIGPALVLVVAQRLVRRLCPNCRKEIKVESGLQKKIDEFLRGLPKRVSPLKMKVRLYEPAGCPKCSDGFKGRLGVFELLEIGEALDALIKKEATEGEIREVARKHQDMVSLQEDGILKALQGVTSLEEVERVTGPIEWQVRA